MFRHNSLPNSGACTDDPYVKGGFYNRSPPQKGPKRNLLCEAAL